MTQITEIAPDMYRISAFVPEANLDGSPRRRRTART